MRITGSPTICYRRFWIAQIVARACGLLVRARLLSPDRAGGWIYGAARLFTRYRICNGQTWYRLPRL